MPKSKTDTRTTEEKLESHPGGKNLLKAPSRMWKPQNDEDRALVGQLLSEIVEAGRHQPVRSDTELAERLNEYFDRCVSENIIPTVEEMALWTGYSDFYWGNVRNGRCQGFSLDSGRIWQKALSYLKGFDAKLVTQNKLNFLVYCFRAKNYYGMRDRIDFVPVAPQERKELSAEDISKRYSNDFNPIDTDFEVE